MNVITNVSDYVSNEINLVDVWKWSNLVESGVIEDVDDCVSMIQYGSFSRWKELYELFGKFEDILNGISQEPDDRISELLANSEKVIKYFHKMMVAVGVTSGAGDVVFGFITDFSDEEQAGYVELGYAMPDNGVFHAYYVHQLSDDLIGLEELEMMVRAKGYK